jgi:hypothetical protein
MNCYLNILGKLLGDARAGLPFLDFATDDLLQVRGRVAIDWTSEPSVIGAGKRASHLISVNAEQEEDPNERHHLAPL